MTRYKAVKSFYDYDGNEVVEVCGFGLVEDIAEAKSQFNGRVEIIEITAEELASLWATHDKEWSSGVMGKIGSIKSEKKAQSSRENGKKGGRPRKSPAN